MSHTRYGNRQEMHQARPWEEHNMIEDYVCYMLCNMRPQDINEGAKSIPRVIHLEAYQDGKGRLSYTEILYSPVPINLEGNRA